MGLRTVTRADLAQTIFKKVGLSRTDSAQLVDVIFEEIGRALESGAR